MRVLHDEAANASNVCWNSSEVIPWRPK